MIPRRIWYTPTVASEFEADAYRMPVGWLIRYDDNGKTRWRYVFRLFWSNHTDRV